MSASVSFINLEDTAAYKFMVENLASSALDTIVLSALSIQTIAFESKGTLAYKFIYPDYEDTGDPYYRIRWDRDTGKYTSKPGVRSRVLVLGTDEEFRTARMVAIIEGEKKAVAFYLATGIPTIGLGGCWGFTEAHDDTNEANSRSIRIEILERISSNQAVIIGIDGDYDTNEMVGRALGTLAQELEYEIGCQIFAPNFGRREDQSRRGADDWLVDTFGLNRIKWPDKEAVLSALLLLPRVEVGELQMAETWATSNMDRFNRGYVDLSDRGNATLWINMLGRKNLLYLTDEDEWCHWTGSRWQNVGRLPLELTNVVGSYYLRRSERLMDISNTQPTEPTIDYGGEMISLQQQTRARAAQLKAWGVGQRARCSSTAGRKALLDDAANRQSLHATLSNFDDNPNVLAVENGVVDLRTGELREEVQEDYVLCRANAKYSVDEPTGEGAAKVKRFIQEITSLDHNVVAPGREVYLQVELGVCTRGENKAQRILFGYGEGSNGKTTVDNLMQSTLGTYATSAKPDAILTKRMVRDAEAPAPTLIRTQRSRYVGMSESGDTAHIDEAHVKQLTGGDKANERDLYHSGTPSKQRANFVLWTNALPMVSEGGAAIWDRIGIFHFRCRWDRQGVLSTALKENEGLPVANRDYVEGLGQDAGVRAWFLWWLVQGSVRFETQGFPEVPKDLVEAIKDYHAKSDNMLVWFEDSPYVITGDEEHKIPVNEVRNNFNVWADANGYKAVGATVFTARFTKKFKGVTTYRANGVRYLQGIQDKGKKY